MNPDHAHRIDPIIGKCPCQMNIIEWCDWEPRARQEFYRDKIAAKKAAKAERRVERRTTRVELIQGHLDALGATQGLTTDAARTLAERIDQAYHPEAWRNELEAALKETA